MLSRFITIALFVVVLGSMAFGASAAGLPTQNLAAQATDQCNNLALGKPTAASSTLPGTTSSQVVDGNLSTMWNAGTFAPQWVEINLGSPQTVDEIRMYAAQTPAGDTTHEVWVAGSNKVYTKVDTITGPTVDQQLTTHVFSPALTSIQWVKVMTTASPSWVGWFEIQVCQTATGTPTNTPTSTPAPTACNDIALGKQVTVNTSLPGMPANQAVDGDLGTMWNAGLFAPQSIEIDLGSPQTVDEIRMYAAQTPAGDTTHELWVAGSNKVYTKLDTTSGFTVDQQLTRHVFSPALTSIQWVKVITTASPSWVAWFEIQVCQTPPGPITPTITPTSTATSTPTNTPTGTPAPPACNDIALGKPTNASAALLVAPSSQAVDGDLGTMWNAGLFAPQSIEINLESPQTVDEIRMYAAQTPAGDTTHELWVAGSNKVYTKLATNTGFTVDNQLTRHVFSPALTSIQWVKVVTTASPSWVAWFEIQVCQTPISGTPTITPTSTATSTPIVPACNNIALGKPVDVASALAGMPASQAVDGDIRTMWNSGQFAPQSIEINLESPQTVDEIRMSTAQTPDGDTTHEVWIAGSDKVYTKVDTITGFTVDKQPMRLVFSPALTSVQWVKVVTTASPSWVAWFEIQVCQTPITGTITPTITATGTVTATSTPTDTPTGGPTSTSTPTNTPGGPTSTATPTPTNTPAGGPTSTATSTSTNTPSGGPTSTGTSTPTGQLGQLKLCAESASGIPTGQVFVIQVNGTVSYNVPTGYCVLAGTYPLNSNVTIQETIPDGYSVGGIEVLPSGRLVSQDKTIGQAVVKIGTGVTEVIYKNQVLNAPTATSEPTHTPTATPSCSSNCTPTPTPIPTGRMQICKEADGAGVSGNFVFRYNSRSKTVPVGACSLIFSINAGTMTITEDAQAGYAVSDIYTIPADRLISKDINNRTATVSVVPGNAATQTIVVFVNRAVTLTQAISQGASLTYSALPDNIGMVWLGQREAIMSGSPKLQYARISTYN